jgi:hypothetical protein
MTFFILISLFIIITLITTLALCKAAGKDKNHYN